MFKINSLINRPILVFCIHVLLLLFSSLTFAQSSLYTCENTGLTKDVKRLEISIGKNIDQKSIVLADSLIKIFEERELTTCREFLWTLNYKANGHEMKQEISESLNSYRSILPIALKNEYWELLAQTYISIARTHEVAQRSIDSKRNLDEAQTLIDIHGLDSLRARLYSRATSYYRIFTTNQDTAKILANQAVILGKKHNNKRARSDGYLQLGMLTEGPYERLEHFQNGFNLNIDDKTYHLAIMFNGSVAGIYAELNQLELAEKAARKNLEYVKLLTEENGEEGFYNIYGPLIAHDVLAQVYEKRGIRDSVVFHRKCTEGLYDKLREEQDHNIISQEEIKDAVEIEKLKAQNILDQLRRSRVMTAIASFALLLLGGLIYTIYKNRNELKAKNKLISEQMEELSKLNEKQVILLSEVHHRVKNNLQNIISLLTLQEQRIQNTEDKLKISDVSNKIYSIALIHEQLYKEGDFELIDVGQYFTDLLEHYKTMSFSTSKSFHYSIETHNIKLNLETVIPLGIICSEVISNSLKYGDKENSLELKITTDKLEKAYYKFTFSDNGNGYPQSALENATAGMGLILLKSMTRQLNGHIKLYNNEGAITELTFKQKEVSKI